MDVKCYLAKGNEAEMNMKDLLAVTRSNGYRGLGELSNDRSGISLVKDNAALILTGGRESISRFLYNSGAYPLIVGKPPFLLTYARKHRVFGKNETCLKLVCGNGHQQPEDGSEFVPLGQQSTGSQLTMTPPEFGHLLYFIYGWG